MAYRFKWNYETDCVGAPVTPFDHTDQPALVVQNGAAAVPRFNVHAHLPEYLSLYLPGRTVQGPPLYSIQAGAWAIQGKQRFAPIEPVASLVQWHDVISATIHPDKTKVAVMIQFDDPTVELSTIVKLYTDHLALFQIMGRGKYVSRRIDDESANLKLWRLTP